MLCALHSALCTTRGLAAQKVKECTLVVALTLALAPTFALVFAVAFTHTCISPIGFTHQRAAYSQPHPLS